MKKNDENQEIAAQFLGQMQNLQNLLDQVSLLEARISTMTAKLNKFSENLEEPKTETRCSSSIIPFPGTFSRKTDKQPILAPFNGKPGVFLPPGIPDFRPHLQRNGLILLAWDKRITEKGKLYSAYWVTSSGIPRYYASKPLRIQDFTSASPDHKSYAAEDGIEFYGQDAPAYIVHVAPELMMSNPRHVELRASHIKTLKRQGSKVDFNYKYLLKTDKNRCSRHQTGA